MYQVIDEKEEQKKYNEIVNKITPESLGLKPTNDFAQYALQTIIDDNPDKVKQYVEKGAIGVMEAGKRYAQEFNGTYDNIDNNANLSIVERAFKNSSYNDSVDKRIEKNKQKNKQKKEERNKRIYNGTASILDKIGAGLDNWGKASYQSQLQNAQQQADSQMPNKDNSNFRYTPVSVDRSGRVIYNETDLRKKIGFTEALSNSIGNGEAMPFVSGLITGNAVKKYRDIIERIRNNEAIRQDELDYVNYYIDRKNEEYVRGYTIGGRIGKSFLPSLMAFGSEIALGGAVLKGLNLAGKGTALGTLLGKNLLKSKKATKNVAKGAALVTGTVAEAGINAAVTSAVNPSRIFATYQERRLNDETKITDRGTVIFQQAQETPAKAFIKSLGQVYISYFTEGLGGLLTGAGRGIKSAGASQFEKVMKANPVLESFIKKTSSILAKAYEKLNKLPIKGKSVEWLKGQVKFDGFIEELGEEVLEDVLNLTLGTNNEERSLENYVNKILKTPEEWAVLCGVITLQGTALSAAGNSLGNFMQSNGSSFEDIVNVAVNSTEAEKIELLDEAINKGLINIDENALYDEIEAQKDEIEEQAYNKLLKGNVSADVALANSKLFGQFFKKYGAKNKEAFDKWFNKLDVQFNVTANKTKENLRKQAYQKTYYQGANSNTAVQYGNYADFENAYKDFIEESPEDYKIDNFEKALDDLKISEDKPKEIKTPFETVQVRARNIRHIIDREDD